MKQQEVLDKKNISEQKKQANRDRLAAIKAARSIKKITQVSSNITTNTASTITPKTPISSIASTSTIAPNKQTITTPATQYTNSIKNVDLDRVRNAWISWNNSLRSELGLPLYTLDARLNSTATEWSEYSKTRGYIIHGRPGDGCIGVGNYSCYNYTAIDTWFKARGIDPVVIDRAKHTENIGTRGYSCRDSDCTDEIIVAIRKTYDFFLSEKSYNGVHYKSLVNPVFTKIGVGISVDESK